jgi:hypothetical protein
LPIGHFASIPEKSRPIVKLELAVKGEMKIKSTMPIYPPIVVVRIMVMYCGLFDRRHGAPLPARSGAPGRASPGGAESKIFM